MKARYNRSSIMTNAWKLKAMMGYSSFSQALKHAWLVAKNEVIERESEAKKEAIREEWRAKAEAKRIAEVDAEKALIAASGMDLHTYSMSNYYAKHTYNGD